MFCFILSFCFYITNHHIEDSRNVPASFGIVLYDIVSYRITLCMQLSIIFYLVYSNFKTISYNKEYARQKK